MGWKRPAPCSLIVVLAKKIKLSNQFNIKQFAFI